MSEINDDVELIRSNKGGLKLIHRGYMYTVHKKRQTGGIRWRCSQRSLHCKGSISTGEGPPKVNMAHNHIPDPHSVAIARCRQFEEFAELTPLIEMDCEESNIRRWRKLKSLIFSKGFLSEAPKKKRLVKKTAKTKEDFIYEIEKLDIMKSPKQSVGRDYIRLPKQVPLPRVKQTNSPPNLSPTVSSLPTPPIQDARNTKEADADEVCLRWNSHHSNMKTSFPFLLQREQYVDVTLTSEGKSLKCHRLILSSCSAYFDELLSGISPLQHPVIFLSGISFWILKCLIDFMYAGEVHIEQNRLESLLKVAEMLQIKGLTGKSPTEEPKLCTPAQSSSVSVTSPVKVEKQTPEHKISPMKKDTPVSAATIPKISIKKASSPALASSIDPLSLLEPTFFEENPIPLKFKEHVTKKVITKKIKKRKSSEHEPSPPPILFRKGTKSRPHVKVPRYYHNDYEDLDGKKTLRKEEPDVSIDIVDVDRLKSEPLDIEEVNVQSSDKRKSKDSTDKLKPRRQIFDKKTDSTDETKVDESVGNNAIDLLERQIKLENIDVDYIDVANTEDHDLTT